MCYIRGPLHALFLRMRGLSKVTLIGNLGKDPEV